MIPLLRKYSVKLWGPVEELVELLSGFVPGHGCQAESFQQLIINGENGFRFKATPKGCSERALETPEEALEMSEEALEIPEGSPNEPVPSLKRPEGIARPRFQGLLETPVGPCGRPRE